MNPMMLMFQQNIGSNPLFQQAQKMSQGKSEQEIIGELQKMFYATGLYADRLQKGEN